MCAGDQIESESRKLLERVGLRPGASRAASRTSSRAASASASASRGRWRSNPKLILLDEPVSALDVSIQAQVINLLDELQDDLGLSYVFVAHDLSVVRHVSDRIAVMYLGKMMELSPAEELYTKPIHPYTLGPAERDSDPRPEREPRPHAASGDRRGAEPDRPSTRAAASPPAARARPMSAAQVEPQLTEYAGGHLAACHHPQNVTADEIAAPSARR